MREGIESSEVTRVRITCHFMPSLRFRAASSSSTYCSVDLAVLPPLLLLLLPGTLPALPLPAVGPDFARGGGAAAATASAAAAAAAERVPPPGCPAAAAAAPLLLPLPLRSPYFRFKSP